jgi:hypothetical protein
LLLVRDKGGRGSGFSLLRWVLPDSLRNVLYESWNGIKIPTGFRDDTLSLPWLEIFIFVDLRTSVKEF